MYLKTSITYLTIHVSYSNLSLAYIRYSTEQIVKALNGPAFCALTGVISVFNRITRHSMILPLNVSNFILIRHCSCRVFFHGICKWSTKQHQLYALSVQLNMHVWISSKIHIFWEFTHCRLATVNDVTKEQTIRTASIHGIASKEIRIVTNKGVIAPHLI